MGKWTSTLFCVLRIGLRFLLVNLWLFLKMSSHQISRESSEVPRSESLEVVPLVEHLPTEELDSVSPLVLWSIFDGDNIEYYPCHWIGLWTEEEDNLLSRILRVCVK